MNRFMLTLTTLICAVLLTAGCSAPDAGQSGEKVGDPRPPMHLDRSTPEAAVHAYLDGISFAYRVADSDIASDTYSEWEYVRVDSYIELNRQEGRGIEQTLTAFEVRDQSGDESTMTVSTYEEWMYRYFSLSSLEYTSEEMTAAYNADYTVIRDEDLWVVDKVKVAPINEVQ